MELQMIYIYLHFITLIKVFVYKKKLPFGAKKDCTMYKPSLLINVTKINRKWKS